VEAKEELDKALKTMGNICPDSVPDNDDEDDEDLNNPDHAECNVVDMHGDTTSKKTFNHVDLMKMLDMVELERGTSVAGGRGYFLRGDGVRLNQAIIQIALTHLGERGFTPLQTPFMMQRDAMSACAQLSEFHEALYKVTGNVDGDVAESNDLKYLIATSEQPIACFHMKEKIDIGEFPLKYAGYSTCFRKEAGKHGKDEAGIYRTHQFEKVEQFVLCSPEGDESWKQMEGLLKNATDFYKVLEIPFRVVNIVSGELNDAAAKKFDLEAWFPGGGAFRELVSCSNCLDYQARRLDVRYGTQEKAPHCHMLNSTLSACERTMCCLVENYQTPEGIRLPEALRPFMGGREFIRFKYKLDKKGKRVLFD
jgi:seryl-tRNA synthetase